MTRTWRSLLLIIVLATALSGAWAPSYAGAQWSAVSGQWSVSSAEHGPLAAESSPADMPLPAPYEVSTGRFRYFSQTAHFLRGAFLMYWESHGATPVLGLPITEALTEDGLVVQYLERARLEWHPEISSDPGNRVLLTRLGAVMNESRGMIFPSLLAGEDTPVSVFFTQTGHNLSNAFLTYWQHIGGL